MYFYSVLHFPFIHGELARTGTPLLTTAVGPIF